MEEDIKDIEKRVNETKNAFHKLGWEGHININLVLNDIENLITKVKELKEELKYQKELKQIEIYKLNTELKEQKEINNKIKEDLVGKSIQELGTSKLYMEDIEKHIPRID